MSVTNLGTFGGTEVKQALLESDTSSVSILSYGAITKSWRVKAGSGTVPILLGFDTLEAYQADKSFMGIIAGRVANRTKNGRCIINGLEYSFALNDYPHHLHGGECGFGKRHWNLDLDSQSCAVQLRRVSAHLEEGYPGTVDVTVKITLFESTLTYEMIAIPDRPTPINLAQHNYYNLMGTGSIWDHEIESVANNYTPTTDDLIPTGEVVPLETKMIDGAATHWDLSEPKAFGCLDPTRSGIDINLVLPSQVNPSVSAVKVTAKNGFSLEVYTNQPGLQFYTGKNLSSAHAGFSGQMYRPFKGFCLEPQKFPSSLTIPSFPSIICTPEQPYKQTTSIKISST